MKNKIDLSIKQSILLLILFPSFLITSVLTTYLIISRQSDAQNELLLQANNAINYLLSSSELSLFSGDVLALKRFGNAAISNDEIKSAVFFDSSKKIISISGELTDEAKVHSINSFYSEEKKSQWIFQTPVFNSEIEVDDYNEEDQIPKETSIQKKYLGWIQLTADKGPLLVKQKKILWTGFSISLVLFGLLVFFAVLFSRSLAIPLYTLINTVRKLEIGDLDARVSVDASGELKELVDGVNLLADKVKISNNRLNMKVKEATHRLTSTLSELEARNIDLELTGNKLIDANNAKDEFLASVSHELRTPLTSIIGYADLLKKTALESEQISQLNTISQASEILLHLIDNILDFSKLESESLELEHIPFNINDLLNDVSSLHMPAAMAKGVKLQITADINLTEELIGDPLRIKQVLNNLIQNAIKFTNEGSVTVTVSPVKEEFGLLIAIQDTGIGIETENQTQLFKPFNQLDSSITRRFGGTGLGLVICKKIVTQLGGKITINSKINKGTEVVFSILNIQPSKKDDQIKHLTNKKEVLDVTISLAGKLVLIAEDNVFVNNLVVSIFEKDEAKTISTEDGSLALEVLEDQKPDLVVLDYQMPILDGFNTCREIRKKYAKDQLPIILLTADVIHTNRKEMKEIGFNKIIYKPIRGDELLDCAYELVLDKKKASKNKSEKNKVLDLISDDFLKEELEKLKSSIIRNFESKDYTNLKKHTHQLCGVAGPSSKYKKLSDIAISIDLKIIDKKYDELDEDMNLLKSIRI